MGSDEVKRKDEEEHVGTRGDKQDALEMKNKSSNSNSIVLFEKEFAKWRFY